MEWMPHLYLFMLSTQCTCTSCTQVDHSVKLKEGCRERMRMNILKPTILYEYYISFTFLCAYFFFFLAGSSKSCCFFLPPPLLLLPPTKYSTKLFQTLSNIAYGMKRLFLSNSNIFQSQSLQTYDFTKIKETELLRRFGSQIQIKIKFQNTLNYVLCNIQSP